MSGDAGKNRKQGGGRGAFLLVNTPKLTVILGLSPLAAGLVFGVKRLNLEFLAYAFLVLILSSIALVGASLIAWQKIKKQTIGCD